MRYWRKKGYDVVYGDASDLEFIGSLPLKSARWVISAMPQHDLGLTHEDPRLMLIEGLKAQNFAGKIAVSTHREREVKPLQDKGADLVFLPFNDAAAQAVARIIQA